MSEGAWGTENDPLYEQAVALVRKHNRPSISLVQRHFLIGYNRAHGMISAMVGTVIDNMPPVGRVMLARKPHHRVIEEADAAIRARQPEQEPHYLRPEQASLLPTDGGCERGRGSVMACGSSPMCGCPAALAELERNPDAFGVKTLGKGQQ